MKKIFSIGLIFLFLISFTTADMEDFSKAEKIISQNIPCDQLNNEQLELIGDYYMEQMHPGDAHEYMDKMMGGEGSESLRQMHIAIAKRVYCNENSYMGYGMPMMGYGMMNSYPVGIGVVGYDNYPSYSYWFNWFFIIAFVLIIVLLAILIFKQIERRKNGK